MRRALVLASLLAACTGGTEGGGPPRSDSGGGTGGGGDSGTGLEELAQPELTSPLEAVDLDPAEGAVEIELTAAPMVHELTDWRTGEVLTLSGYAYDGQTPGPTVRARLGDTVRVTLHNELDTPTTIHWHGLDVPWEMDGVTWMQDPIQPGESFTYAFTVSQAGTFWYHPHFDTDRQVDLGLYGVLVVEDPAEDGAFDREIVAVLDDWGSRSDEVGADTADTADPGAPGEALPHHHGDHDHETLWALNGLVRPALPLTGGEAVRLRLVDASNTGYAWLSLAEAGAAEEAGGVVVLATDQGRLPEASEAERLLLSPGDRAELALLPGEAELELRDHPYVLDGGEAIGEVEVQLDLPVAAPAAPAGLPDLGWAAEAPAEDPGTTDVLYVFQGDSHTGTWMINGEQYPDVTVHSLALDQDAVIEVRNLSSTEHPFHLHGHSFEVLSVDGVAPVQRTLEDTVNVPIYAVLRLRLVADNPGDWMAHCHILPHGHGGMMTVLRVE